METESTSSGGKRSRQAPEKITVSLKKAAANKRPKLAQSRDLIALPPPVDSKIFPTVVLSQMDKASQLRLNEDQLTCFGCEGGYRMVRANRGVYQGGYYWEAEILCTSTPGNTRIGWSTRQAELQAPVGYDSYSYGYRDLEGSKVHDSNRHDGFGDSYGPGDIIGCYINLSEDSTKNKIVFYKNGEEQGVAYHGEEVKLGTYFPAVSMFKQAVVRVNFGPTFIIDPGIPGAQAISELQPMNPQDRKVHDLDVMQRRREFASRQPSYVAK